MNGGDGREASGDPERGDPNRGDPNRNRQGSDGSTGANSEILNEDRAADHQYLARRPLNRDQRSNNFATSQDDNEGGFINNLNKDHDEEDNLINSGPNGERHGSTDHSSTDHGDAPGAIRHWSETAASEPLSNYKANEQSGPTDEQQEDEENYRINRRINRRTAFYRARL